MDNINFDMKNKKYDFTEILLNSDDLDNSDKFNFNNDKALSLINTNISSLKITVIWQIMSDPNILDKLYIS